MAQQGTNMELDRRDRQLLALLEADAWLTYAALAERVNLSASAVQRRVERLIAAGAILGARARLSPAARGRPVRLYVLVELAQDSGRAVQAFARQVLRAREVVEADYVAGGADIVLVIEAVSLEAYAAFTERVLSADDRVRRFQTLTVMRSLR